MSRKRRMFFKAAQRDASEGDIIKALRTAGATVWQVSGKDIPDLLVGYKGQTFLLEVKTPGLEYTDKRNGKTYKRDGALREGQKEFFASWTGGRAREVFTPEEALMAIGAPVERTPWWKDPECQSRETAAVVPAPRRCECGHWFSEHAPLIGLCGVDGCSCKKSRPAKKDPKALATSASYPARKP